MIPHSAEMGLMVNWLMGAGKKTQAQDLAQKLDQCFLYYESYKDQGIVATKELCSIQKSAATDLYVLCSPFMYYRSPQRT